MLIDTLSFLEAEAAATSWMSWALCAETNPEAFFPEKGGSPKSAKQVCDGCPVRAECLDYALDNGIDFGVWGGTTEADRRRLKRVDLAA